MNRFRLDRDGEIYFIDGRLRCPECKDILLQVEDWNGIQAAVALESRGSDRKRKKIWLEGETIRIECCGKMNCGILKEDELLFTT